jgi:hypothetical protein
VAQLAIKIEQSLPGPVVFLAGFFVKASSVLPLRFHGRRWVVDGCLGSVGVVDEHHFKPANTVQDRNRVTGVVLGLFGRLMFGLGLLALSLDLGPRRWPESSYSTVVGVSCYA